MRTLILILLAVAVGSAYAQDKMTNEGHAGQDFGDYLLQNKQPQIQYTPGGDKNAGTVTVNGQQVPINQLAPGADQNEVAKLQQLKDADQATLNAAVAAKQQQLASDPSSNPYRTAMKIKPQSEQQVAAEPMWQQTTQTLSQNNLNVLSSQYGSCQAQTTFTVTNSTDKGMTHERSCEVLNYPQDATINMTANAGTAKDVSIYNQTRTVTADMDIPFDGTAGVPEVLSATYNVTWSGTVRDVAISDYPTQFNNWRGTLHITYDTGGAGAPQSATYQLTATITPLNVAVSASPTNPLMGSDSWCTAHWTCTDSAPRSVDGVQITASMVPPLYPTSPDNSPPSSQAPLCWAASSTYQCPFNLGTICWTSASGQQQCQTNTQQNTSTDTCKPLLQQQSCSVEHSECAADATGFGGFCYVTNYTLDCPSSVQVPNIASETTYPCAGAIRCMGNDCVDDRHHENSIGFADMQAQLNLVQHILADVTPSSGSNVSSATGQSTPVNGPQQAAQSTTPQAYLFPGNAYECRKILGSTVDFCTEAAVAPNQTWFALYTQQERQGNARKALAIENNNNEPSQGAGDMLRDASNWKLKTVRQPFTARQETVNEDMPDGSQNTLQPAANGLGNSTQLTPVMTEYRKEETGNQGVVQNWAGTKEELDLATQRAAGACVNIGSYCKVDGLVACLEKRDVYCCFNSAMSRNIRVTMAGGEQAVANGVFGSPTNPQCGGIDANTMSGKVLQNIDYDDWEARSQDAGALPTLNNIQQRYSMDRLTGQGSSMVADTQTQRPNVLQRTQARVAALNTSGIYAAVSAQAQADQPPPQPEPDVPGSITFNPAYYFVAAGQKAVITISRTGGKGAVSVNYATTDSSAVSPADYAPASGTLQWADGDTSGKTFVVPTTTQVAPSGAQAKQFIIALSNPTGGATLGSNTQGEVDINGIPPPAPPGSSGGGSGGGNGGGGSGSGSGGGTPPGFLTPFWASSGTSGSGTGPIYVNYQLTLTNTGAQNAQYVVLTVQTPGGLIAGYGNDNDPIWVSMCGGQNTVYSSDQIICSVPGMMTPGTVLQVPISLQYPATMYGATVQATCSITYQDSAAPPNNYTVQPVQCTYSQHLPNAP